MLNLRNLWILPHSNIQWKQQQQSYMRTEFVQTKFNMGTLWLITIISLIGSWLITWFNVPSLAESNSQLARISAGQCLKFCDDTPSVATLPTLNNPQDLDPNYWRPVFPFSELQHMGAQVSKNVAWTVCQCFVLLKQSHLSTNHECQAVILVPAAYVIPN